MHLMQASRHARVLTSKSPNAVYLILSVALLGTGLLYLTQGAFTIPWKHVLQALWTSDATNDLSQTIIWDIRLPRLALASLSGAVLGLSGSVMQSLFRNPLADPSLIGVTAGASLGASLAIFLTSSQLYSTQSSLIILSGGAFCGGLLASLLVYLLAKTATGFSVSTMLLAGIAVTAFAGSIGNVLEFFVDNTALRRISLWRMGGLDAATSAQVTMLLIPAAGLAILSWRMRTALNLMLLGDAHARFLGVHVMRVRILLIIAVAVGVSTSVAMGGTMAFVGLMAPHFVRLLLGPDNVTLLPASALMGALLLTASDLVARLIIAPSEIPAGVVTALLGVPFFLFLLRRHRNAL
jgi:iron complex transport system permease protein